MSPLNIIIEMLSDLTLTSLKEVQGSKDNEHIEEYVRLVSGANNLSE